LLGCVVCCLSGWSAFARELPNPPEFHFGDWLVLRPGAKIQIDARRFAPELEDEDGVLLGRRLRFGIDGTLLHDLEFRARIETRKPVEFRDVYVNYVRYRAAQFQAGRFKIPFGLDQLEDSGDLDFVYRSRLGSIVAPGRDAGVVVHRRQPEGIIEYAAGVFLHDGRNTEIEDFAATRQTKPGGNRTTAGRVVFRPTALQRFPSPVRELTFGAAFTHSDLETGLGSLPGVTVSNQIFFPRMYVSGSRRRRGAEFSGRLGELSIKAEFMDAREQRLGQGLRGETLPDLRTQGWYVSAVHPLIGHLDKSSSESFLSSIIPGRRLGLIEAAARYEVIRFGSVWGGVASSPSRSPRAANVVGNDDRIWTLGLNWHATRYVKLQLNGVHETLRDPERTPIFGKDDYWTLAARLQLYF